MTQNHIQLTDLPKKFNRIFHSSPSWSAFEHQEGWANLLGLLFERLTTILETDQNAKIEIVQIKEKFGTLSFYYRLHGASDATAIAVSEAVDIACEKSSSICEKCGRDGKLLGRKGWFAVRCINCDVSL